MIVCTAGHRPFPKLGGYSEEAWQRTLRTAEVALFKHPEVTTVITGMAQGWDQALAQAAININIPLIAAVPLRGFECKWTPNGQAYFHGLIHQCEAVVYVDELDEMRYRARNRFIKAGIYSAAKMQTRNTYMVDNSDAIFALWDGSSGGTRSCLDYNQDLSLHPFEPSIPVFNFWPEFKALA